MLFAVTRFLPFLSALGLGSAATAIFLGLLPDTIYPPTAQHYRNNPTGLPPYANTQDSALDGDVGAARMPSAVTAQAQSLAFLNRGDAELALGKLEKAREFYQRSINQGRVYGAPAAMIAARRLQLLTHTCEFTRQSVKRISDAEVPHKRPISLRHRQQALISFGYYKGKPDGQYGPMTTNAVRAFQEEIGAVPTGGLTPLQTALLICAAAQIQRDLRSQTLLGMMYVGGWGVVQNADLALHWLGEAHRRGSVDATYNLAILHGINTVDSSVYLCGIPSNLARADSYLRSAAKAGHPKALGFWKNYRSLTEAARWARIKADLNWNVPSPAPAC